MSAGAEASRSAAVPRTVAECVDDPRHAGPLDGAVRIGEAGADGRMVRIGLFADGGARFRATGCASLIAYAEVACAAIERGERDAAGDPRALRARLRGVHPHHHGRAALVAAAVRAALEGGESIPGRRSRPGD
jgi:hypothetical protein